MNCDRIIVLKKNNSYKSHLGVIWGYLNVDWIFDNICALLLIFSCDNDIVVMWEKVFTLKKCVMYALSFLISASYFQIAWQIYVFICIYIYVCIYAHTYICRQTCIHRHIFVKLFEYTYVYLRIHINLYCIYNYFHILSMSIFISVFIPIPILIPISIPIPIARYRYRYRKIKYNML